MPTAYVALLLRLSRPEGLTVREAVDEGLVASPAMFGYAVSVLRGMGHSVESRPLAKDDPRRRRDKSRGSRRGTRRGGSFSSWHLAHD